MLCKADKEEDGRVFKPDTADRDAHGTLFQICIGRDKAMLLVVRRCQNAITDMVQLLANFSSSILIGCQLDSQQICMGVETDECGHLFA